MPAIPTDSREGQSAAAPLPTLAKFLEEAAPGQRQIVAADTTYNHGIRRYELQMPAVALYCDAEGCDDVCFFDPMDRSDKTVTLHSIEATGPESTLTFNRYRCRHCRRSTKVFALRVISASGKTDTTVQVMKFGEDPPAIGPTPRALQDLLGDQWSLYLQGRRSELAGLGIGAFVYYRRGVEHIWKRVLTRLIDVAKIDGSADRLATLTAAQGEPTFTRSMEAAKGAIPPSLYVDGHNPFQALYDACGDGVHEYSDAECIARSRMIRLVLARFAERAKAVLSEDQEFRQALGGIASKT